MMIKCDSDAKVAIHADEGFFGKLGTNELDSEIEFDGGINKFNIPFEIMLLNHKRGIEYASIYINGTITVPYVVKGVDKDGNDVIVKEGSITVDLSKLQHEESHSEETNSILIGDIDIRLDSDGNVDYVNSYIETQNPLD